MSLKKKLVAGISALAIALSLTSCTDTTWANKVEDKQINAGIYIYYTIQGYNDAKQKLSSDSSVTEANIFTKKIDDKSVSKYVEDYATNMCKRIVAVDNKFSEVGLELTEADEKTIRKSVDELWEAQKKDFTQEGIGKSSIEQIYRHDFMFDMLFDKYYAKNGLEEVSKDDINKEIVKKYARVKIIPLYLTDDKNQPLDDAGKAEVEKQANVYIDRFNKGESFDKLVDEYYKKLNNTDTSSTSSSESSSEADKEANKYQYETVVYEGFQGIDAAGVTEIFKMENFNMPQLIKTSTAYLVVQKLDILERDDLIDGYTPSILRTLKSEDFKKMVDGWAGTLSVEINKDSYERYSPEKVIEKMKKNEK